LKGLGNESFLVGTVGGFRITGLGPAADCREVATSGGSGEEEDAPELHVPASKVCSFALQCLQRIFRPRF